MHRRQFLASAALPAALAGSAGMGADVTGQPSQARTHFAAGAVTATYTAEDHRNRLLNIGICRRAIQNCLRKHLISNYLPAQCCYNLGEYPSREPWNVSEYDAQELDRLRDHGIQLIQVFDEWNDSLRLFGADKYTAVNPDGFRKFIRLVHDRGMRIMTYGSSCFLQRTDPDFRQEWSRDGDNLVVGYWNMARCSPSSAGWRAFLLPRLVKILDDYELDGIYIDGGYVQNLRKTLTTPTKDEVIAFEETAEHDGAFADLLALIYSEVKRRGGILKLHVDGADQPRTAGLKVYDYLWVGEGVGQADGLRAAVRNHEPYVVPCIDLTFAKVENDDEPFLHSIPYMQFPVLQAGRPFTGERGMIPGVKYAGEGDFWVKRCLDAWKSYQAHPQGPHSYGTWDAVPGRPETQTTHAKWLKRYMPLVEEGTWAWLEIGQNSIFRNALPPQVVASAFANRDLHLVLANYGTTPVSLETTELFADSESPQQTAKAWILAGRTLRILKWCAAQNT
jgi:hypothetical protein